MVRSRKALLGFAALTGTAALVLAGCAASDTPAEDPEESSSGAPVEGEDLSLNIGTALPVSGSLSFLGPPEIAGVDYAASLINAYAETTGLTVDINHGDSGDLDNKAYETEIPRLLAENPAAIIGAASSGVSLQFIDQVTGAGVIQFSPANTSDAFTTYDDNGLYFRTAPSDTLQGDVHGNFVAELGHQTLGLIVLNDAYGTGLAKYITDAFEAAGGEVVAAPTFNPGDTSFDSQIAEVLAQDPDAITVISFDEAKTILPTLIGQGFPAENVFLVDGNMAAYPDFEPGLLEGAKGTYPGPTPDQVQDFIDGLDAFVEESGDAALSDYTYAPESYDATILLALASLAAQSTDSAAIAEKLIEVSGGSGDGEKCESYEACADIILGGGTADYDGASSPITFDEVGDPTEGFINIYEYGADNTYTPYEG
ncbi:ABC transporter substrate-binding protein [Microbacterium sediminis]|uniref:Amino acid ABC transporter substrate-binding protein n=1 Tax=Microbacterium sediminis TaxID=904291 RepID=A0A1B9NHX5_9MICO|nr:ABC transporter substrate-binding protein [Microbacterium sediminis]OCG76212.1 amino acid ABC transporter substrate-binding protein [Microbacterium sediminis]QBR73423.1 amino acid ABC transporter substrate-binding protein [Microbacterium sediminis]